MATTPYLRLRIPEDLTNDSRYNLNRLDSMGANILQDSLGALRIRSAGAVYIQPNSVDIGGSGSGGTVEYGESGNPVEAINFYANEVNFSSTTVSGLTLSASQIADGSVSNTEFLCLNGVTSNIQAQIDSISGANQMTATWTPGDGPIKTITHGFGSFAIMVQVLDVIDSYRTVEVDVTRPNNNQVVLTASETIPNNFLVLLTEIA